MQQSASFKKQYAEDTRRQCGYFAPRYNNCCQDNQNKTNLHLYLSYHKNDYFTALFQLPHLQFSKMPAAKHRDNKQDQAEQQYNKHRNCLNNFISKCSRTYMQWSAYFPASCSHSRTLRDEIIYRHTHRGPM